MIDLLTGLALAIALGISLLILYLAWIWRQLEKDMKDTEWDNA